MAAHVFPAFAVILPLLHCPAPPAFPLHTASAHLVDSGGHRVRLNAVNWYGAESPDFLARFGLHVALELARRNRFGLRRGDVSLVRKTLCGASRRTGRLSQGDRPGRVDDGRPVLHRVAVSLRPSRIQYHRQQQRGARRPQVQLAGKLGNQKSNHCHGRFSRAEQRIELAGHMPGESASGIAWERKSANSSRMRLLCFRSGRPSCAFHQYKR